MKSRLDRLEGRHLERVPAAQPTADEVRLDRLKDLTPAQAMKMSDAELIDHLMWFLKRAGAPDSIFEGIFDEPSYFALERFTERVTNWERSTGISLLSAPDTAR